MNDESLQRAIDEIRADREHRKSTAKQEIVDRAVARLQSMADYWENWTLVERDAESLRIVLQELANR